MRAGGRAGLTWSSAGKVGDGLCRENVVIGDGAAVKTTLVAKARTRTQEDHKAPGSPHKAAPEGELLTARRSLPGHKCVLSPFKGFSHVCFDFTGHPPVFLENVLSNSSLNMNLTNLSPSLRALTPVFNKRTSFIPPPLMT